MNLRMLLVAGALVATLPAMAHEEEIGPNGGRVVEAGNYHVELVARGNQVDVFITDANDKALAPTGFKGLAILVISGKSVRVTLEPADGTKLSGKATGPVPSAPKGVVQITAPGGKTAQAKFN